MPAQTGVIYLTDDRQGLFAVNASTLSATRIGTTDVEFFDIAVAPDGKLYGLSGSGDLYTIDPDTAATTLVGWTRVFGLNALIIDPFGNAYAMAGDGLYRVNLGLGDATLIGRNSAGATSAGDLVFRSGRLFASTDDERIVELNPATGAALSNKFAGVPDVYGLTTVTGVSYAFAGATIYDADFALGVLTNPRFYPSSFMGQINGAAAYDFGQSGIVQVGGAAGDNLSGGVAEDVIYGFSGNDTLAGGAGSDLLLGSGGTDVVSAGAGADYVDGQEEGDFLLGGGDNDRMLGGSGVDLLGGEDGDDFLTGGADGDNVYGGTGADLMFGEDGLDFLSGQGGDDVIGGNGGWDVMHGGAGADRFLIFGTVDSNRFAADIILDFVSGQDRLDIAAVDANELLPGDQAFQYVGYSGSFTGVGTLRLGFIEGVGIYLFGYTNGDDLPDLMINIGTFTIAGADILL